MKSMTRAARARCYLSRHERQLQARAAAFSRRTAAMTQVSPPPVKIAPEDIALVERLVRHDRTVVSSALLAVAGMGAGVHRRREVLAQVSEVARAAEAAGAISAERSAQIARHVRHARDAHVRVSE